MNITWSNSVLPIAIIFSFRMLGLFMLIPVFTVFAMHLKEATPALIGIALGSYGLSQALLQIPFGILSDYYGRKHIITLGLIIFAIGSLVGALTDSIYGMIAARILQGMGAIGSVLIALVADLTPEQQRTQAMAVIGVTIGVSFGIAMIISPVMTAYFGLASIFYLTAFLALTGLILLHVVIPTPEKSPVVLSAHSRATLLKNSFLNRELQQLNAGIFLQHAILTSTFFAVPMILEQQLKLGLISETWHFYLSSLLIAFVSMLPLIYLAERKKYMQLIYNATIFITSICQLLFIFSTTHRLVFYSLIVVYFTGFNFLEAALPALISKKANPAHKGASMGIYSSCQFLGIFFGGTVAGLLYQQVGINGIFMANSALALIWLMIAQNR